MRAARVSGYRRRSRRSRWGRFARAREGALASKSRRQALTWRVFVKERRACLPLARASSLYVEHDIRRDWRHAAPPVNAKSVNYEVRFPPPCRPLYRVERASGVGHEDQFTAPRLSAACRFSQRTFARMRGNGRDAPFPAIGTGARYY